MTSNSPISRRGRRSHIRDQIDPIFESKGFYRKHVAQEEDSLFRAISDFLFGTQARRQLVENTWRILAKPKKRRIKHMTIVENEDLDAEDAKKYEMVCLLAEKFCFAVEIIKSNNPRLEPFCFTPKMTKKQKKEHGKQKLMLCHTPPNQFDPVYSRFSIENAGFIQSILYEMLYVDVFKLTDAMDAANIMLTRQPDPVRGKPDYFDPDFDGTAMEALDNFLIPFPYKVAKALDPYNYRNIEYDVWTCEMKAIAACQDHNNTSTTGPSPTKSSTSTRSSPPSIGGTLERRTIGSLLPGTPCVMKFPQIGQLYGYVQGPTQGNRKIEVFIPLYDQCVYVERNMVCPITRAPPELEIFPRRPFERPRFSSYLDQVIAATQRAQFFTPRVLEDIQRNNMSMVDANDPEWLRKFNFGVPPPPPQGYPDQEQQSVHRQSQVRRMGSRIFTGQDNDSDVSPDEIFEEIVECSSPSLSENDERFQHQQPQAGLDATGHHVPIPDPAILRQVPMLPDPAIVRAGIPAPLNLTNVNDINNNSSMACEAGSPVCCCQPPQVVGGGGLQPLDLSLNNSIMPNEAPPPTPHFLLPMSDPNQPENMYYLLSPMITPIPPVTPMAGIVPPGSPVPIFQFPATPVGGFGPGGFPTSSPVQLQEPAQMFVFPNIAPPPDPNQDNQI